MALDSQFVTIITSSAAGAFLTIVVGAIVNARLQKTNYKRDYYKKIIDRRMAALEVAIDLIRQIITYSSGAREGGPVIIAFPSKEDYSRTLDLIVEYRKGIIWVPDGATEVLSLILLEIQYPKSEIGLPAGQSSLTYLKVKLSKAGAMKDLMKAFREIMGAYSDLDQVPNHLSYLKTKWSKLDLDSF